MGAIVGIISGVLGMGQTQEAGAKSRAAGEAGARSIIDETRMNVEQTKKVQAQTLGFAKAAIAASGIKFDASKISRVKFAEGGIRTGVTTEKEWELGRIGSPGPEREYTGGTDFTAAEMLIGGSVFHEKSRDFASYDPSDDYGQQIAGEEEGGSSFTYLREMKKEFAKDIGWQFKQGVSRAKVAQMGGTVAYAQSKASLYQQGASTYQSGYNWWKGSESA